MQLRQTIRARMDQYYHSIHINDFSSFIKSDFRDGVLFDLSEERAQQNARESRALLEDIARWRALPDLCWEEEIELDIVEDFCRYILRNSEYFWYKFNLTHNTTPLPYVVKRLETFSLSGKNELNFYCQLLEQFPEKLAGMVEKLRRQQAMGILLPDEQAVICRHLIESLFQGEDSLLRPWRRADVSIAFTEGERRRIDAAIDAMNAALEKVLRYLRDEYVGGGTPGLCHIKGGLDYYRQQIITYTSYALEPEELHRIGLRELEITREKMRAIIRKLGYDMDLPEFQRLLREKRICFDDTPEQLQQRFDRVQAKIEPRLSDFFLRQPQARCRSQRLPAAKEKTTSWGYYSVPIGEEKEGVFWYSAAELDSRSQIRTAAIVAHELLPGHHFQTNLLSEDDTLPEISQQHFNTAYADGWAEYSADLVNEMGVYDLYDLYGRYVWDMVLCCRLVVDTGLNALGWDIARARAFMRENTILTDSEIFTETLRYSVDMPAQALAYKFGSLKMHELRQKAETALGERFDLRVYHDEVLRYGSAPLNVLEKIVGHYIETHKS